MGPEFLIDTNAVIDFCGGKLPASAMLQMQRIVNTGFFISPVIQIEVLGFDGPSTDMQRLKGFISFGKMLYITDNIIQATIDLRKSKKMKLGDAIIAATALVNGLTIITRNAKDFSGIANLLIEDPYLM